MLYMGFGNFTLWLEATGPGAGVKTAYEYGNQQTIMPLVRAAGMDREDIYLETMVPCGKPDHAYPMNKTRAAWYIQQDLDLLNVSAVDLLLIHHKCSTPHETQQVWMALEDAKRQGLARDIGVSNFEVADLEVVKAIATEPIAVNEAHFAVGVMDYDVISYCAANNITLVSFSSLSAGVSFDDATLRNVAAKHNATAAQVMLRFVSQHNISVLSSISEPQFVFDDLHIFDFELSDEDMATLKALQKGKRTCQDCYTDECQDCGHALQAAGCPVQKFPLPGRDNPKSAECVACAAAHNETVMDTCGAQYMVDKACGTAGGFPKAITSAV